LQITTRWGKVGADGQSKSKDYKDAAAAEKDANKQIAAKKKGRSFVSIW
jgi:predicted DNA-binding WGR domain protein